jgi:hypothetical protein
MECTAIIRQNKNETTNSIFFNHQSRVFSTYFSQRISKNLAKTARLFRSIQNIKMTVTSRTHLSSSKLTTVMYAPIDLIKRKTFSKTRTKWKKLDQADGQLTMYAWKGTI